MTQPGQIDGVMTQMTQSFNPLIHRRIEETMRNPTVLKWLALPHRVNIDHSMLGSFSAPLLLIIAQSLKPLNLLSTKDT